MALMSISILLIHLIRPLADSDSLATIAKAVCPGQIAPEKRPYRNLASGHLEPTVFPYPRVANDDL